MPHKQPVDFQPTKRSIDYLSVPRPVVGFEDEYPSGYVDPAHSHQRAQLLYSCAGVTTVVTDTSTYAVPPQRALWLPAGMTHEVSCRGHVSPRTLYIDPEVAGEKSAECRLIEVSDFLKALILEVVTFDNRQRITPREEKIIDLLLAEIDMMPTALYQVRMPWDKRLARACRSIIEDPSTQSDLDELAKIACMSRRAFTRLFKHETGMSFAVWRQQMRLIEALSLISAGRSVTMAAYDVGYNSPSAFTAAFHRTFGVSPSYYQTR